MSDDRERPDHGPPPHDEAADEPLGPATPDDKTPAGDSPEVHDELSPHDLPKAHPGRRAAEENIDESSTTRGNT